MGSSVKAQCTCGFEKDFIIGGGMMNFATFCAFPCYCEKCRNIVEANLISKPLQCPKCKSDNIIPYDNKKLRLSRGKEIVCEWNMEDDLGRNLELYNGNYFCPKCRKMSLKFINSGICWD